MSKDVTYTEEFLAEDRVYNAIVNAGGSLGKELANFKNKFRKAKGTIAAVKTNFKMNSSANDDPNAEKKARWEAIKEAKGGVNEHRAATKDAMKTHAVSHKVGGAALGAVAGAAVGAGVGHLATSKSRKKIAYLEAKGGARSTRESAELAQLKRKVNTAKAVGGIVGGVAAGVAGHHFGGKMANKGNRSMAKAHVRMKMRTKTAFDKANK